MQPPQKYQPLRDAHARVAEEAAGKTDQSKPSEQAKDASAEKEPEPTRPTHMYRPSVQYPGTGGREPMETAALEDVKQRHMARQQSDEKPSGKEALAADMNEARDAVAGSREKEPALTQEHVQQQTNAGGHSTAPVPRSGNDLLAADLKEAKENVTSRQQPHDPGRSR